MRHLYLFASLLFITTSVHAKHIIGGVLTYECLGNGQYRFTMKMYRDCAGGGAGFDQNAPFTIYKGSSTVPLTTIFRSPTVTTIQPVDNPCLIVPPNVCVQEGVYTFDYTFAEWPSNQSYHITYQRCCRNETITNIQNPGDVGATFTVELLPSSQALCNNSPVYNSFPPIAICANEALNYSHSAFDAEGDQLIYEFCAPLLGGGQGGIGGPGGANSCTGVTPNPACPPPYQAATFVNPPYSPLNPMGGNPQVTINPITGLLTGTPTITGQFTVGVCVKEYRNGQLLSIIRRDFQFNVLQCTPVIVADVNGEGVTANGQEYSVKTCNGPSIFLENKSTNNSNITDWRWEFFVGDSTYVFNTWDVNVTFPKAGTYEGRLILNPGSDCNDTASLNVEIYPELIAAFDYAYDTCVAGPVNFTNLSHILGDGQIVKYQWNFGDGGTDTIQQNPVYVYDKPKVAPVKLEVWDQNGCKDDTARAVVYKPVPSLILVRPNDTVSCAPATLFFNNLSSPIDPSYLVEWDFGDGETGKDLSPTHIYRKAGLFDVRLEITSPIGCYTDTVYKELIKIYPPPVADFYFDPTRPDNFNPKVNFFDESIDAVHWDWYVNDKLVSQMPDFTYSFPDTGVQEVKLIITHPEKCLDTLVQYVDVTPKVTFHMPNAFTPNEDSVNDLFQGAGVTRGVTDFRMQVWNRWGQKIFETTDVTEPWNGRVANNGRDAQAGVYVCVVSFTGPRGEPFEYKGYATLMR